VTQQPAGLEAQERRNRRWLVACCKSHNPTRGQGVTPRIIFYLLPRTRNLIVSGRGKGELVSTVFPQISSKGKPPKVTLWPSLFAQKPLWNKPNQEKNIMAPTFSKAQPSLWEASSGNAGLVAGATSAKKRQKIVKTEVYKVLDNRCMPIRSQAGRSAAQAGKGDAGDHATGSPAPVAILSQYDTSDDNTDNKGANNDGTNNEAADNEGLGDGLTKEEAVKWGAGTRIDGAAYSVPMEGGTYNDGIDKEVAKLDGLYDNFLESLANKESGKRGAGTRTNGAAHAGPKGKVEAAQADTTVGRAEVDKATGGKVDKDSLSGNGGNVLCYGRDGLKAGSNGLHYGMAGLEAAMAVSGSMASCFTELELARQATAEEVATEHKAICCAIMDNQAGALESSLRPKAKGRTYLAMLNAKGIFLVMHGLQW
jgi:hypothetical protein